MPPRGRLKSTGCDAIGADALHVHVEVVEQLVRWSIQATTTPPEPSETSCETHWLNVVIATGTPLLTVHGSRPLAATRETKTSE